MRRRMFMEAVGVGAAVAAVPLSGHAATDADGETARQLAPSLVAPVASATLAHGWRVASIEAVDEGGIPIVLEHETGARAWVIAFRRSRLSAGIARTRLLDLRVMNDANGGEPTPEGLGLAVMALATALSRSEDAMLRAGLTGEQRAMLRALRTHPRRLVELGERAPTESA